MGNTCWKKHKAARWTRSIEESYEKGRNRGKQDLIIAELVVSRGALSAYKQAAKQTIDLGPDGDSQRGKRDGGNGTGLLLDGADNNRNSSSSLKGGKLKTQAKSFPESFPELQKEVEKLLKQMGKVVFLRDAHTGQSRVYWARHDDLSGNGGGGGGNHRRSDNGNEGTGNSVPKHNYSANSKNHLIKPEGVNKTGVSGGHNAKQFFDYLEANGIPYKVENKVPHPSVPGVYDVYYKIAKQERGVYTSEFKASTHKKTVYDETVFTDEQMYKYCQEAMDNGTEYLTRGGQQVIQGTASNGLKFEGWKNPTTGEIESVYPVLEWKNYGN